MSELYELDTQKQVIFPLFLPYLIQTFISIHFVLVPQFSSFIQFVLASVFFSNVFMTELY